MIVAGIHGRNKGARRTPGGREVTSQLDGGVGRERKKKNAFLEPAPEKRQKSPGRLPVLQKGISGTHM